MNPLNQLIFKYNLQRRLHVLHVITIEGGIH